MAEWSALCPAGRGAKGSIPGRVKIFFNFFQLNFGLNELMNSSFLEFCWGIFFFGNEMYNCCIRKTVVLLIQV